MGKQWLTLFFWGSKITADDDCSHEIKRYLLLRKKAMTHLDSILKSRDITLPTYVCVVKAMVFPIVMYGCESWTMKKVEHWRTDAFELWCWRSLLRVPYTARRSNQLILRKPVLRIHLKDWWWGWSSNSLATWCKELNWKIKINCVKQQKFSWINLNSILALLKHSWIRKHPI